VRDRGADRIGVGVWNEQIQIRAIFTKRFVTGKIQFIAGLPPAVNRCDDRRVK
jgi:hypothetical protein